MGSQWGNAFAWRDLLVSLFRRHEIEIVGRQGAIDEGLLMVAHLSAARRIGRDHLASDDAAGKAYES